MATLVKLRGLQRGKSAVADGGPTGGSYRGFRIPVALGTAYAAGVKASLTTALAGANNDLVFTAKSGGTWGNSIQVEYLNPGGANKTLAVSVVYASGTGLPKISVSLATDGASAISSTSASISAAVAADQLASQLVSVANAGADTGAGIVTALAATNLTGGTDVGVGERVYLPVTNKYNVVVDIEDAKVQRVLSRNRGRYFSLGAA
jgi:hypothetical protein